MARDLGPSPDEIARRAESLRSNLVPPPDASPLVVDLYAKTLESALERLRTDPIPEIGDSDAYYREWIARNPRTEGSGPASQVVAAPPEYLSWTDYLRRSSKAERMAWCRMKAKKFSLGRTDGSGSGSPVDPLKPETVWEVLHHAKGRCYYCGGLAVERRPSRANGAPRPWESVGRRIGSLDHIRPRLYGGTNARRNLAWSCLWCNTWPEAREPGATDHGGYHPTD